MTADGLGSKDATQGRWHTLTSLSRLSLSLPPSLSFSLPPLYSPYLSPFLSFSPSLALSPPLVSLSLSPVSLYPLSLSPPLFPPLSLSVSLSLSLSLPLALTLCV